MASKNGNGYFSHTKSVVTPKQQHRICMLAKGGGFSYALIALRVFGNNSGTYEVTPSDLSRIGMVLCRNGIKVRDWRNGRTNEAKDQIRYLLKPVKTSTKTRLRLRKTA